METNALFLDAIPQTKYLSADNYLQYRVIMRLFYREYEKMHYQLDQDTVLVLMRKSDYLEDYGAQQLALDLTQLVSWGNLTSIQDPRKTYTIQEFKNKQFQYMMSPAALEIERMTVTLENLYAQTTGLSTSVFRRLYAALRQLDDLETHSLKDVNEWWQDLQSDFERLSQNHQDYLREFYGPSTQRQVQAAEFVHYKQQLVRYLEEFIQDLQSSSAQISALLSTVTPQQEQRLLELVYRSEVETIPRLQDERSGEREIRLEQQVEGVWQSLNEWFIGENSTARQVMDITNEVIRRVVQNAVLLVQMQSMGGSNKTQLRHFLGLFAECENLDEAHRLSAQVFGAQRSRHFSVNGARETDRIDSSVYDEPPMDYLLKPRVRTYQPRIDRSGFVNKRAEKEAQRQAVLEQQRHLHEEISSYIQNGVLDFAALDAPIPAHVREVLLSWVAMANLSPDKQGRTEYGEPFSLQYRSGLTCRLRCVDGDLTMPDYILIFGEDA